MKNALFIFIICTPLLNLIGCNSKSEPAQSHIQTMDPKDILMTLPSIENTIPDTEQVLKDSNDLEILEDDWRQLEFISQEFNKEIKIEIDSIESIIKNESVKEGDKIIGFRNLHVRRLLPNPIKNHIEINDFKKSFSNIKSGSFSLNTGRVKNGIYFNASNFQLYGLINNNKVTVLGLYGLESWEKLEEFKPQLKEFMTSNKLLLVDWRSRMIVNADGIDNYLKASE